jgi:uncharacterized membrane protein
MAVVVTMVWLAVSEPLSAEVIRDAASPIVLLGITTALSRLAMFAGVKLFGGMQTAILAISEIAVALLLAFVVLGEVLTVLQWLGVLLLFFSIALIRQKDLLTHGFNPNLLIVANMSSVQFQRIAFHRAFGTRELDNESGTMAALTTQEMRAIQQMMGAEGGALDPFPIGKLNKMSVQTQLDAIDRRLEEMNLSIPADAVNARLQEMPRIQVDDDSPEAGQESDDEPDSTVG